MHLNIYNIYTKYHIESNIEHIPNMINTSIYSKYHINIIKYLVYILITIIKETFYDIHIYFMFIYPRW